MLSFCHFLKTVPGIYCLSCNWPGARKMAQEVLERKIVDDETQPHPNYRLLLLNDNRINFDHVEKCLQKHIPGMSTDKAHQTALKAHNEGVALVWVGPKEVGELYYELLKSEGLRTALEPDA
jgi:ATP-dependent Clp protease adaptor protein ClpS